MTLAASLLAQQPTEPVPHRTRDGRSKVAAILLLFAAWGVTPPATAEEHLAAGTKEFALGGGYSVSHNIKGTPEWLTGFQLLPHVGWVASDETHLRWLPEWTRGNLELIGEPVFLHLDTRQSTNQAGVSALARWIFVAQGVARPYVEVGGGVIVGVSGIPQVNCTPNFSLQAGAGVLLNVDKDRALTFGYRFHHISNGGLCATNPSLNSSLFTLGLSYFFP